MVSLCLPSFSFLSRMVSTPFFPVWSPVVAMIFEPSLTWT